MQKEKTLNLINSIAIEFQKIKIEVSQAEAASQIIFALRSLYQVIEKGDSESEPDTRSKLKKRSKGQSIS
jgi:hypothetical protein